MLGAASSLQCYFELGVSQWVHCATHLDGSDLLRRGSFPDSGLGDCFHILILCNALCFHKALPWLKRSVCSQRLWVCLKQPLRLLPLLSCE